MSDYSPPYTEEDAKREARRDSVVARIRKLKLSKLTVGDLLTIVNIFFHRHYGIGERDVDTMEEILRESK